MRAALLVATLVAAAGCYPPRNIFAPPPPPEIAVAPPPPNGSIWHPELAANYQTLDVRARFPGDLLTVLISESSTGKKDATTAAKGTSSIAADVTDFFGVVPLLKFLPPAFKPTSVVSAKTDRQSTGDASTKRDGLLTASITVRVIAVDPNGNLVVRGDKIVGVNSEDQHIVLSGTVKPEDIASDNSVQSSRIADARIAYYGRGVVADKQGVPLVHRLFDWVWPF